VAQIETEEGQQTQQTEQAGDGQQLAGTLDSPHHHQVAGKTDGHAHPQQQPYLFSTHPDAFQPERPRANQENAGIEARAA